MRTDELEANSRLLQCCEQNAHSVNTECGTQPAYCSLGTGISLHGVQRPDRKADCPSACSVELRVSGAVHPCLQACAGTNWPLPSGHAVRNAGLQAEGNGACFRKLIPRVLRKLNSWQIAHALYENKTKECRELLLLPANIPTHTHTLVTSESGDKTAYGEGQEQHLLP
jgi:hypothetical protein